MNQRQQPRKDTSYTALYCSYNGVRAAKIKNLSRSGAAIVLVDDLNVCVNDNATLHFYASDAKILIAKMTCRVVRLFNEEQHKAVGVKFDRDDVNINNIMNFLENPSTVPTPL